MFYRGDRDEIGKRIRIVFKVKEEQYEQNDAGFCHFRGSCMKTINLPQGYHMSQCWLGLKQASLLQP